MSMRRYSLLIERSENGRDYILYGPTYWEYGFRELGFKKLALGHTAFCHGLVRYGGRQYEPFVVESIYECLCKRTSM